MSYRSVPPTRVVLIAVVPAAPFRMVLTSVSTAAETAAVPPRMMTCSMLLTELSRTALVPAERASPGSTRRIGDLFFQAKPETATASAKLRAVVRNTVVSESQLVPKSIKVRILVATASAVATRSAPETRDTV